MASRQTTERAAGRWSARARGVLAAVAGVASGLAGCATPAVDGGTEPAAPSRPAASGATAVTAPVPAKRAIDLDYFEQLERKATVSQDDLLTGLLIVATSSVGRDFPSRTVEAKRLGWIEPAFDRPARRPLLVGELAPVVARAAKLPGFGPPIGEAADARAAQAELERRGWIAAGTPAETVVSGPQFLAVLMRVSDALGLGFNEPTTDGGASAQACAAPAEQDPFEELGLGVGAPESPARGTKAPAGAQGAQGQVGEYPRRVLARSEPLPPLSRSGGSRQ